MLNPIPDDGMRIKIGEEGPEVEAVPAHYCHSSGNFSLYDPTAGILFSGDIGSALVPNHEASLVVTDFDQHIQYMRGFHLRWMPSTTALRAWVQRVRAIKPKMICPQHGSIFQGSTSASCSIGWKASKSVSGKGLRPSPTPAPPPEFIARQPTSARHQRFTSPRDLDNRQSGCYHLPWCGQNNLR